MGWMWLWWLLLLLGVTAVLVGLVAAARPGGWRLGGMASRQSSARRILDDRFARGDIVEDDYRARRRELDDR